MDACGNMVRIFAAYSLILMPFLNGIQYFILNWIHIKVLRQIIDDAWNSGPSWQEKNSLCKKLTNNKVILLYLHKQMIIMLQYARTTFI